MRKALSMLLLIIGGLAGIAWGISGHLMEDQRRYHAYYCLCAGIGLTLIGIVLGAIHILSEPSPKRSVKLRRAKRDDASAFGAY